MAQEAWEYAARADDRGAVSNGPLEDVAWYNANSVGTTHAVGGLRLNHWGMKDNLGHILEWTAEQEGGSAAVLRGCSWDFSAAFCRAAYRNACEPDDRFNNVGFRPARSIPRSSNP